MLLEKKSKKTYAVIRELPEPLLGHILIEAIVEDAKEYLDTKKEVSSGLTDIGFKVVHGYDTTDEAGRKTFKEYDEEVNVPITKGRVLKTAPDVWGEAFKERYGKDIGDKPKIGDVVVFDAHQSTALDPEGVYHIIADNKLTAIYRL